LRNGQVWAFLGPVALAVAASGLILLPTSELDMGGNALGFWLALIGVALFAWTIMAHLSAMPSSRVRNIAIPVLFGLLLVYLWQAVVVGFAVPVVLLPTPTEIASALHRGAEILAGDFQQTFLKSVLAGFVLGNLIAFVTALFADRFPFLQRGLLPLGNFASAVPIVGIAPIMVMWFGFGWESKTAVIVFMIFFPMLVNALAGLNAADRMSLDLMRSYGATYGQTLLKLRLPMALPFLFNALKINSTLALIGAIVAEFFGSPTAGMGFRISVEAARMGLDMVWATIAVAAVAGSAFYGILALLERAFTFWHPSYRAQN
jgi:NitT/TauT family transport system permease protein